MFVCVSIIFLNGRYIGIYCIYSLSISSGTTIIVHNLMCYPGLSTKRQPDSCTLY